MESLKRTLLDDFHRRSIDPETANKILESRMELLREYERRGVPFVLARERVIEEEERWNLLLDFEHQILPFEEAEQRIDHRFELMKMYKKNGLPSEEARRKVLDDEVIHDFKGEFVRLGLPREQAQKQAERRLWMLENLHNQGVSPDEASQRVLTIERELKQSLDLMRAEKRRERGGGDPQAARWMVVGEELEAFIMGSCRQLGLTSEQSEPQIRVALEALDRYQRQKLPPEEAKCRVLVDDLPIPGKVIEESLVVGEKGDAAHDPGSQADITSRVQQFLSKLNATVQVIASSGSGNQEAEKPQEPKVVSREQQLAEYDQQSRLEIQNLLSDMLKMKVPADEARRRLEALYKEHENLRESLFPSKKAPSVSAKKSKPSTSKASIESEKEHSSDQQPSKEERSSNEEKFSKEEQSPIERRSSKEGQSSREGQSSKKKHTTKEQPGKSEELSKEVKRNSDVKPSNKVRSESSKKDTSRSVDKSQPSAGPKERSPRRSRSRGRQSSRQSRERRSSPRQPRRSLSRESRARRKSPSRKNESTADGRWNASVEMFLQQYGLNRNQFRSESTRRHSVGQDRYSPSDLSPRNSRSRDSRRSPGRGRPRSRSRPYSPSGRSPGRTERRRRSRSLSGSPPWRSRFLVRRPRSRTRTRSRSGPRYKAPRWRSPSPAYRSRLLSIERELNYSPDFSRRSPPPRRSHYSPERSWSPPRRSWDRSPGRDRFHPGGSHRSRRSRSQERFPSPSGSGDLGSPEMHRMLTPLDNGPRRPKQWRGGAGRYRTPPRELQFSFEGGVWPDQEESLEKYKDW